MLAVLTVSILFAVYIEVAIVCRSVCEPLM
jgi:hypothetical protein